VKYQTIITEIENRVGIISLNRPEKRNALSTQLMTEMLHALKELEDKPEVGAIIIRSSGDNFCSGHDFSELQGKSVLELRQVFGRSLHLVETIAALRKPVIAAVRGYATAMGCALAAGCDLVIASEDALFQLPGTSFGAACISPAAVVCRSMDRKKCLELLLTADPISAHQAEKSGLINRVVRAEELDSAAEELAEKIASKAPLAVQLGKQAFYNMIDMEESKAYSYAAEMISINFDTEDAREGIASFIEKRKRQPWRGR
jgi:enoyl-CoA hydratase/carnithine racemase